MQVQNNVHAIAAWLVPLRDEDRRAFGRQLDAQAGRGRGIFGGRAKHDRYNNKN